MDVAALGMRIDSSDVVSATRDLEKFAASADRAAGSAGKLSGGGSTAKLAGDYARAARAADQAGGAVAKASQMVAAANAHVVTYRNHLQGIVTASGQAAAAQNTMATAVARTSTATQQADGHVIAFRENLARLATANKAASASGATAATGVAAVGVAGKATGTIISGLAGILGGFVGVIIGAVLSALIEFVAGLFETDKAMKAVELGADSLGDAQGVLGKMFDLTTGKIKSQNEMLILNARLTALNMRAEAAAQKANFDSTVGGFRGNTSGVGFGTKALGFLGFDVSGSYRREQGVAAITQGLKDGSLTREQALQRTEKLDFSGLNATKQEFQQAIIDGAAAELKVKAANLIDQSLNNGVLAAEFREPARATRAARDRSGGGGKSDAEKLADIVRNANAEITAEQNRAKAVEMSAEAAVQLEQKTKLLNAASAAGLKVTPELAQKMEDLATTYAKAKIDADMSEVITATTEDIQKQRDALADQTKLTGLYGDALARATREMEEQKKLRDALPKGSIYVGGNLTGGLSDDIEKDAREKRIAMIDKVRRDSAYSMELERNGLYLTGQAAIEYTYISEKLIEAKRQGIRLAPEEIAAIKAAGAAYAEQRYELDQAAKFQNVLLNGAQSLSDGFADAIVNAKSLGSVFKNVAKQIIADLIRIAIQQAITNSLMSAFGGGFSSGGVFPGTAGGMDLRGFAKGGAFDGAQRFADGGAFTNTIVSNPTLFKFANGSKFGLMGEAGPEAVMPLIRGTNGKLGVQAHGGRSTRTTVRMGDVHNTYQFDGAVGIESIVGLIRQGGESTKSQIRRELQSMLDQLERDGTLQ